MCDYKFTTGDVDEAVSIMKEAAQWLTDTGKTLWNVDDLLKDIKKSSPHEFIVMYDDNGDSIATLILNFEDKFMWSDIPPNVSGFIHKLAVRRKYAGKGMAKKIIDYAISICKEKGIKSIRLDCHVREKLCSFYESLGFVLVKKRQVNSPRLGEIYIALYKRDLD